MPVIETISWSVVVQATCHEKTDRDAAHGQSIGSFVRPAPIVNAGRHRDVLALPAALHAEQNFAFDSKKVHL
ncbi:hypothetical protein CAK95_28245 [Pseudorhodoplanes sinuspersici]|uniref:Uncharacterized protein n=1 Tax=Pseudorhodoplanes sinuspersici TaxID=1235591 RepID=A0A1W6ZYT1_9HYPH|nr:hypothetical protein CAK95_28245 [Pseudorhodoplanes sinuspersici]